MLPDEAGTVGGVVVASLKVVGVVRGVDVVLAAVVVVVVAVVVVVVVVLTVEVVVNLFGGLLGRGKRMLIL